MLIHILFFLTDCKRITNKKINFVTLPSSQLEDIHKNISSYYFEFVRKRCAYLENAVKTNKLPWSVTKDRNDLYNKIYAYIFDSVFRECFIYCNEIYRDAFECIKSEFDKKAAPYINDVNFPENSYIMKFVEIYSEASNKILYEIQIKKHEFHENNPFLRDVQKIGVRMNSQNLVNFKVKKQKDFFKNIIEKNIFSFALRCDDFYNKEYLFDEINEILDSCKNKNVEQIIMVNFNSDIILLHLLEHVKNISKKDFLNKIENIKKILNDEMATEVINYSEEIKKLKETLKVKFIVSGYRSDYVIHYYDFLRIKFENIDDFSIKEITDVLFDLQKNIQEYLLKLFDDVDHSPLEIDISDK